jgi:hypothetical protein
MARDHALTLLNSPEPDYRESVDKVLRGLRARLTSVEGDVEELEADPGAPAAHAATHLPGGADALATAAPVTIGTANSAGAAASFARSDHVHAISLHASRHQPGGADPIPTATPVAIGPTLAEGSSTSLARADHVHTVSLGSVTRTIREIDFTSLATNAFTDGTESVDGTNGTVAGSANAGSAWGITNAVGLRCNAPTSTASVWTHATPNGPSIEFALSALVPTYDPGVGPLLIEAYMTTTTLENAGDRVIVGLRRAAGTPITGSSQVGRYAIRQGVALGTGQLASFDGSTITAVSATDVPPQNTLCLRARDSESAVLTATYSGGWGVRSMVYRNNSDVGNNGSLLYLQTRLVIAFAWANDAPPTSDVVIARLRLSYAI